MNALDSEELLYLAIKASEQSDHEGAITKLKAALDIEPDNSNIIYMLAAEHAEIGMYQRAAEGMQKAIELDPKLYTAAFQLGLLHMTNGETQQAVSAWQNLDVLGEDDALFQFKTGLVELAKDNFSAAKMHLLKGMELNDSNEALNKDMQRIVTNIDEIENNNEPPEDDGSDSPHSNLLLNSYNHEAD